MTRLLLLFALAGCNITSNIPPQYDRNDLDRAIFYLKKMEYYEQKYEASKGDSSVDGIKREIYLYAMNYYANKSIRHSNKYDSLLKDFSKYIDSVGKRSEQELKYWDSARMKRNQ